MLVLGSANAEPVKRAQVIDTARAVFSIAIVSLPVDAARIFDLDAGSTFDRRLASFLRRLYFFYNEQIMLSIGEGGDVHE